ncbi:hypothetical protein HPB50_007367 [Hyalomma asiaticum]|uniref:Uncharacterized protein n=1 Tax=Hyalomma asiaticum TaxID=266040 RepID=A0ACB7TAV7_HYAAI|nr:hypothetical protein HPB50_007367 [Hyalomma asiaticum]
MQPTSASLYNFSHRRISTEGRFTAPVAFQGRHAEILFYIVKDATDILGIDAVEALRLHISAGATCDHSVCIYGFYRDRAACLNMSVAHRFYECGPAVQRNMAAPDPSDSANQENLEFYPPSLLFTNTASEFSALGQRQKSSHRDVCSITEGHSVLQQN